MRLDDASEHMNLDNWIRMKELLDKYQVKPIYGIIPFNKDSELLKYDSISNFWEMMRDWEQQGWTPALHGCTHVFETASGGINPVNHKSEFAGVPLEGQREKIKSGYDKLMTEGIQPAVFFAPAHTFDENTLRALEEETPIRIISDTIANDTYYEKPFYYIPQQSGNVRNLPFKTVTFCYHPNTMDERAFHMLEEFLNQWHSSFETNLEQLINSRHRNLSDRLLKVLYFALRKLR